MRNIMPPTGITNRLVAGHMATPPKYGRVERATTCTRQNDDWRLWVHHDTNETCDANRAETICEAYSEPATKRKSGPKLFADAGPMKRSPAPRSQR